MNDNSKQNKIILRTFLGILSQSTLLLFSQTLPQAVLAFFGPRLRRAKHMGYALYRGWHLDSSLWAFGKNISGQLGDGTLVSKSSAVRIGTDNDWLMVSSGTTHSMGIRSDTRIYAWGDNSYGKLGDGTQVAKSTPIQVRPQIGEVFR